MQTYQSLPRALQRSSIYLAALWLLRSFEPEEVDFAKRALNRLRGKKA